MRKSKIPRHKVPNLIHLVQNNKKQNAWPRFFTKIDNSLKLLQEPINYESNVQKQPKNKFGKGELSLRLKQLCKHKERLGNYSNYSLNTNNHRQLKYEQSGKQRPLSLPRMTLTNTSYKNHNRLRSTSTNRQGWHSINQQRFHSLEPKGYQQIAGTKAPSKSFSVLLKQIQLQYQTKMKEEQQQRITELSRNKSNNSLEQSIIQNQMVSEEDYLLTQDNVQRLTQQLVKKGEQKMYQNYDKILMNKIKIYKPKKFKFMIETQWKI